MSLPYISNNGRRKSSFAGGPNGRAAHHEHNPGPSVTISANRDNEEVRQSRRAWAASRLAKRSHDSGEDGLIDEEPEDPGRIVAETTIVVSDHDANRRRGSSSHTHVSPMQYSNERPSNYGWGEPPETNLSPQEDTQGSIPMVPMRAKTSGRPPI